MEVSDEQLKSFAKHLRLDWNATSFRWLTRAALEAPCPCFWSAHEDDGRVFYWNDLTQSACWEHPLDAYFKGLVAILSSRNGAQQVLMDMQAEQRRLDAEYRSVCSSWTGPFYENRIPYWFNSHTMQSGWVNPLEAVSYQIQVVRHLVTCVAPIAGFAPIATMRTTNGQHSARAESPAAFEARGEDREERRGESKRRSSRRRQSSSSSSDSEYERRRERRKERRDRRRASRDSRDRDRPPRCDAPRGSTACGEKDFADVVEQHREHTRIARESPRERRLAGVEIATQVTPPRLSSEAPKTEFSSPPPPPQGADKPCVFFEISTPGRQLDEPPRPDELPSVALLQDAPNATANAELDLGVISPTPKLID
jgi:hypothetical protein